MIKLTLIALCAASFAAGMDNQRTNLLAHSAHQKKKAAAKKQRVAMCLGCGKHIFLSIARGDAFKIDGNWFHTQCPGSK